jgi:hypothetical protein
MKIAVVTPYHKEPLATLARCHESVRAQTVGATHIMVADGHARSELTGWDIEHITLPVAHADFGGTPRIIGGMSAKARGFDYIQWLDADCWLRPDHLERMLACAAEQGVGFVAATRSLHREDGSVLRALDEESDGSAFCDTNCMFMGRAAFWSIPLWGMVEPAVNDRLVWDAVRSKMKTGRCTEPTVCYTASHHFMYVSAGEAAPAGTKAAFPFENKAVVGLYDPARDLFAATAPDGRALLFSPDGRRVA